MRPHPSSTLFPYTTLFRSSAADLETIRLSFQAELAQDYFELQTLDAQRQRLDASAGAFAKSLELTRRAAAAGDRKSTRLNSSHGSISYAVFCLKKKTRTDR